MDEVMNKYILLISISLLILLLWKFIGMPEKIIIPTSYRGEVLIVYGMKEGVESDLDGIRKVYKIPENGILYSQEELSDKWVNVKYYLKNKELNHRKNELEKDTLQIGVHGIITGRLKYKNMYYDYQSFLVGAKQDLSDFSFSTQYSSDNDSMPITLTRRNRIKNADKISKNP